MSDERRINAAVRRYWAADGRDIALARDVVTKALATPPASATVLARALTVASRAEASGFAKRIEHQLAQPLSRARKLVALIDSLGDDTADPTRAFFDDLAGWVSDDRLTGIDLHAVTQARLGSRARPNAARAALDAIGWERLDDDLARDLDNLLEALEHEATTFQARVLVVTPDRDAGLSLGVNVIAGHQTGVEAIDEVDLAMRKQAMTVLSPFAAERGGIRWSLEWPLRYAGESIGLALQLAALVSFRGLRPDPLLAATGAVDDVGRVGFVEGVPAKLRAARAAGIRRVLLPRDNEQEALAQGVAEDVQLLFVEHVDEVHGRLNEVTVADELSFAGRVRQARAALPRYGLSLKAEKPTEHSRQLVVTDATGRAILELWSTGKVRPSGPAGSTRERVAQVIADVFVGDQPERREPHQFMLADEWRQRGLRERLEREGAQPRQASGTSELWRYALRRKSSDAQVTLWTSGKGYLTGSAPAFDEIREFIGTAQEGLANVDVSAEPKPRSLSDRADAADLPSEGPWIGTDESGKGDYFGPLVSAAVFADADVADRLRGLGVQDSKRLTDKRVRTLAPHIRTTVGKGRYKVTPINPARYNQLYAEFKAEGKNLNSLLAWGHTRSIEDLIRAGLQPSYAIVDQFADARYIEQRLMTAARQSALKVLQFPKAETDIAVAAASILAREAFLDWLERTSAKLGFTLPKGASPQVIEAAKRVIADAGNEALAKVAKLHFKTTDKVLA